MGLAARRALAPRAVGLVGRRDASTVPAEGYISSIDEPMSTEALERALLALHAPGAQSNPKWAYHGGHQRARNFAAFHGLFPALLPKFTPCVELVVRLAGAPPDAPPSRSHVLYGNRLRASELFGPSPPALAFAPPAAQSDAAATLGGGALPADARWTLVVCTFSPAFAPAMVDGGYLTRHALPAAAAPPAAVAVHAHLVAANMPAGRPAEGEVLLASDMAGLSAAALRAALLAPAGDGAEGAGAACVPDPSRKLYLAYLAFQHPAPLGKAQVPEGRSWPLGAWVADHGLVPRGLAFCELEIE